MTIQYTVRLPDGTLVSTTSDREPLAYVHGSGELLPAIERALAGLRPGDAARVRLTAQEARRPYNEAKVTRLPRARFPAEVEVGDVVEDQIGRRMRVVELGEDSVIVDWNEPLAGRELIVDLVVLDVQR